MDLVRLLSDPDQSRALITWNINIAASNPRQTELHTLLKRDDLFHVAIDCFATDTTDFADSSCRRRASWNSTTWCRPTSISRFPPRPRRPMRSESRCRTRRFFRRLARAMGFTEPGCSRDDATILDTLARQAGLPDSRR